MKNILPVLSALAATRHVAAAVATRPCDIYNASGMTCVAAHSTVRALYGSFGGPLYLVRRSSDNATKEIGVSEPGGFADSLVQDEFCKQSSACIIDRVFDQSPNGNHLNIAPGRGGRGPPDQGVDATKARFFIAGHPVYGAFFDRGAQGYRNDNTSGVARDDEPESMYMVVAGNHYNSVCCFDYGNAETDVRSHGAGTMEAIYWGNDGFNHQHPYPWTRGTGQGPWVMADLEHGLWAGTSTPTNANNTPIVAEYVTAMLKGRPGGFTLKGGNAQSGHLKTLYDGKRPWNKTMHKQGAIILGIGGDNSHGGVGTFYEGVLTAGYASDAADEAVQANIVAAGYGQSLSLFV